MAEREKIYGKAVPVIHASFACKEVPMGEDWRVYLNASGPDGDRNKIICPVDFQTGVDHPYPISITRIPEDQRKDLSGYAFLDTSGINRPIQLSLTLQIQDKTGHSGAPLPLSLSIVDPKKNRQDQPPAEILRDKNLGPLMIVPTSEIGWRKIQCLNSIRLGRREDACVLFVFSLKVNPSGFPGPPAEPAQTVLPFSFSLSRAFSFCRSADLLRLTESLIIEYVGT